MPTIPRTGELADTVRTDLVLSLNCRTATAADDEADFSRCLSLSSYGKGTASDDQLVKCRTGTTSMSLKRSRSR